MTKGVKLVRHGSAYIIEGYNEKMDIPVRLEHEGETQLVKPPNCYHKKIVHEMKDWFKLVK